MLLDPSLSLPVLPPARIPFWIVAIYYVLDETNAPRHESLTNLGSLLSCSESLIPYENRTIALVPSKLRAARAALAQSRGTTRPVSPLGPVQPRARALPSPSRSPVARTRTSPGCRTYAADSAPIDAHTPLLLPLRFPADALAEWTCSYRCSTPASHRFCDEGTKAAYGTRYARIWRFRSSSLVAPLGPSTPSGAADGLRRDLAAPRPAAQQGSSCLVHASLAAFPGTRWRVVAALGSPRAHGLHPCWRASPT